MYNKLWPKYLQISNVVLNNTMMFKVNKTTQHAFFISIQRNSDLSATLIIVTYNRNCWGDFLFSAHQISVVCGYEMISLKLLNALWELFTSLFVRYYMIVLIQCNMRLLKGFWEIIFVYFEEIAGCLSTVCKLFIHSIHFLWQIELRWKRFCDMFMNSFSTQM